MTLLFAYLALALCVSFMCSLAEAVLLSLRPAYVAACERQKTGGVAAMKAIQENLDRPLAAILTLNTVAHTVGAAGVGAQAGVVFGNEYLGVTSAVLTLLILVLSEIVPKTLGATHWKRLAPGVSLLIFWLTKVLHPFVLLSEQLTKLLSRSGEKANVFSREEIQVMAELGAKEGVLELKEVKIVENLLRLHKLSVRHMMTPRPVIFMLPEDMSVEDFFQSHADEPFSRIPVYGGNRDNITGYVLKHDLLLAQARDEFKRPLSDFCREFVVLPEMVTASQAFDRLTRERCHLSLVVDEYGTLKGLVSLEDIVETLTGLEITDEQDTVENLQELAHQRWRERMQSLGIDPDSLGQQRRTEENVGDSTE